MSEPNLSESAWQKAKDDAWGVIKTPLFGIGGTMVGLFFGAATLIASEGQPGTTQVGASLFFGVLSVGITLSLIFFFQLVAAPMRQRNALREAWPLGAEPSDTSSTVKLWSLYRKGCDLAIRLEATPPPERDWIAAEKWADDVGSLLADAVPEGTARAFFVVGENEDDLYWKVSERASKLKEIIEGVG